MEHKRVAAPHPFCRPDQGSPDGFIFMAGAHQKYFDLGAVRVIASGVQPGREDARVVQNDAVASAKIAVKICKQVVVKCLLLLLKSPAFARRRGEQAALAR